MNDKLLGKGSNSTFKMSHYLIAASRVHPLLKKIFCFGKCRIKEQTQDAVRGNYL